MKVIVSNHKQAIYGQVTVPLPIPDEEYDHVIDLLENLEIGDFRAWDCHVDEISDCPPVLKRLEGTQINIDELDYLAKRLESFISKELAAFQGMVEKMDYTEVFDMINLSFYCDEITVITDFKDTAAIGRNHVLAKNGAMAVEELEKMDLAGIGRELIASGKGMVTPYGIIYDEGVDILSLYNGEVFPEDRFTVLPPQTHELKLYMPLTADLYERDEWGDLENEATEMEGRGLLRYEAQITSALLKNQMPEEKERGIMHWYHDKDSVEQKVRSIVFKAEERDRQLWGVAECQITQDLTPEELDKLKEYISGQASDGWGEGFEQREIQLDRGAELYVHLWSFDPGWKIQTEEECFGQKQTQAPQQQMGGMSFG